MGMTFACFNFDGYCPVVTRLSRRQTKPPVFDLGFEFYARLRGLVVTKVFIICASGKESKVMEDFNTRTGQEYKPCDLLEGRSKISVSSFMEVVGSKKDEVVELLPER